MFRGPSFVIKVVQGFEQPCCGTFYSIVLVLSHLTVDGKALLNLCLLPGFVQGILFVSTIPNDWQYLSAYLDC